MIANPMIYLLSLALIVALLSLLQRRFEASIFAYTPLLSIIYLFSMLVAYFGLFIESEAIVNIYRVTKTNLLPAMLFLLLLQVDIADFFKRVRATTLSSMVAILSLALGFIIANSALASLFGGWMGAIENSLVASSALVIDSVEYTLWVMLWLILLLFTPRLESLIGSKRRDSSLNKIGCSCTMGAPRYWLLILLGISVSLFSQILAESFFPTNRMISGVLFGALLGAIGSFTKLREINGTREVANSMLYMLVALIGSQAIFESSSALALYLFAGFSILALQALFMLLGARLLRL